MCFLTSVAPEHVQFRRSISIPILVETLLYASAERQVIISCDVIAKNDASEQVDLVVTHPDDVQGRLATEDWFCTQGPPLDDRANLVRGIYRKAWEIDRSLRTVRFINPTDCPVGELNEASGLVANSLSFRADEPSDYPYRVEPSYLDLSDEYAATYRMKAFPIATPHAKSARPFSGFRFNLPGNSRVFFRLSVVINGPAYGRLIDGGRPNDNQCFSVIGPDQILQRLERDFPYASSGGQLFAEAYSQLREGYVEPQNYHIIIGQPDPAKRGNKLVRFRPTSLAIRELYVPDEAYRDQAIWFHAVSADFRIVLQYQDNAQKRSRTAFFKRLAPALAARARGADS